MLGKKEMGGSQIPQGLSPYEIAYLRAGMIHAINVAAISLANRGLLIVDKKKIKSADPANIGKCTDNLEREILKAFEKEKKSGELYSNELIKNAATEIEDKLIYLKLLSDSVLKLWKLKWILILMAILLGTGIYKIIVGINLGRPVEYLILLTLIYNVILYNVYKLYKFRTLLGDKALYYYESKYMDLKKNKKDLTFNGQTDNLAIAAALFGFAVLPYTTHFITSALKTKYSDSSSSWTSSGGCGGGGCGGGGCGGCG